MASTASQNLYTSDLHSAIVVEKNSENVVYSPVSMQTCLVLAFLGAEGKTAEELDQAIKLGEEDKSLVSQRYEEYLRTIFRKSKTNTPQLIMSNPMFVNDLYKVLPYYNALALKHLQLQREILDFGKSKKVLKNIYKWIEKHIENKIQNFLQPDVVSKGTSAILVKNIFFKGKWLNLFNSTNTSKMPFHKNANESKTVDMMYTNNKFNYTALPEFDAEIIELPNGNSKISKILIFRNKKEYFKRLEERILGENLNDVAANIYRKNVKIMFISSVLI